MSGTNVPVFAAVLLVLASLAACNDEDAVPAAPEAPASQQAAGRQFVYNFDTDTAGQMPAKFHSAKTGGGAPEKWAVTADPAAPSKPNSVTQTSNTKTHHP